MPYSFEHFHKKIKIYLKKKHKSFSKINEEIRSNSIFLYEKTVDFPVKRVSSQGDNACYSKILWKCEKKPGEIRRFPGKKMELKRGKNRIKKFAIK